MSQRASAENTYRRPFPRVSAFLLVACAAVLGYAPPAAAQFGGVPTFVIPPPHIPINTNPVTVAVGDLNADTYPDLVIPVNAAGGVAILLNNGAGGGFTVQPIILTGPLAETAVLADLNADGKLDIVVANIGNLAAVPTPIPGTVSILLGDGDGTFTEAPGSPLTAPWSTPATAASPWSVAVGRIDAGANLDLAVVNQLTNNVSIFLGNGNGTFGAATTLPVSALVGTADPRGVAIADLNGDTLGDVITTNYYQGTGSTDNVSVLIRQAGGGFAAPVSYTTGAGARSLAVGLMNADAIPDVVVANSDPSNVTVLIGNGTGGFNAGPTSYTTVAGGAAFGVSIGDLNGDGKADVAVTNFNLSTVSLFRGDGLGALSAPPTDITSGNAVPPAISSPAFAGIGDFNKDGQNDLAVTNFNLGSASIFINNTVPQANLSITKVKASPTTVVAGSPVVFTTTVNNAGPDPAAAVTVTDPATAGLTFVSNTGDCTTAFPCALGTMAAGGAAKVITSNYIVPSGTAAGTTVTNVATVSSTTADPVAGNNSSTAGPFTVTRSTDLSITKVKASPATLVAGQNVVYTITVSSAGPSDANAVQVTDPATAGLQFVSNAGACTTAFPCDLGTFVAGTAAKVITSTWLVQSGAGATVTNSASVSSTGGSASPDPNTGNNTSSTGAIAVTRSADLGINKAGPTAGVSGQDIVYTITITNAGPSDAASVTVADPVPAGLTFVSNSGACGTAFPCNLGTVAAGGPAQVITSTWNVTAASGSVTNTATVSSTTTDPTPANNTSSVITTIGAPSADMSITKTGPAKAFRGQNIVYTVTVTNNGPTSATGVSVTDTTPAGLSFVSNTGACTTAYPCTLGTLASGAARTITSTYSIPAGYAGAEPIVNTATVTATTTDPTPGNNSATATTPVDPQDFHTVAPCRVVDTRDAGTGGPSLVAGASRAFAVSGSCGIPASAKAVSVNVTVVGPTEAGDLRLYPAGTTPPLASTINYSAGQVRANNAVIRVSATGIEVLVDQATGTVDFILDVNGYFEP